MTAIEIVKKYLTWEGYDGMATQGCGCGIEDFPPSPDCNISKCEPAMKRQCVVDGKHNCEDCPEHDCENYPPAVGEVMYVLKKQGK